MPAKAATTKTRTRPAADHVSYQDMIIDGIVTLKERNGSSRVALKKYIKANHKNIVDGKMFDSLFNRALKSGVEKGIFAQPKGASGGTKLAKKESKTPVSKPTTKVDIKTTEKKAGEKKSTASKKVVPAKKAGTCKPDSPKSKPSPATTKSKALSKTKKTKSKEAVPPEVPAILSRTKSGRITKSISAPRKVIAPKKKTTTPMKKGTPKKVST
ncbi:putative histone h1 [Erysiphe necator]|uniref:Histone H1 n=1 Tax=Uncinula necator TaxID=52586 RepID=A0A0B1NZY5_UNCNE|nr:putative histone h1 [Erysiphe necator]